MRQEAVAVWTARPLDLRLLGSVTAERAGDPVALGGPRQRAVLARLALARGAVVTTDRLIDDIWSGEPPASANNTLQSYVSLLRRALGDPGQLRREGPGYRLDVPADALDYQRFEQAVAAGQAQLELDPEAAVACFDEALAEWRGPALADFSDEEWATTDAQRLGELRLIAAECRFRGLLQCGRHAQAIPELERAVSEHPLREGLAAQLMIALYRSGRQADALRAFGRTRETLLDELGLDPTPELVALEAAILRHDPSLAAPPTRPAAPTAAPAGGEAGRVADAAPAGAVAVAPARDGWATDEEPSASPVRLPAAATRSRNTPFVGREKEMEHLRSRWADASGRGQRHLVLLTGAAGMGKTRLAGRFASDVHRQGALVMWGRATQEALVPYEPIVEAFRTILRTVSKEARLRVVEGRPALALLLPDLGEIVPGVQAPEVAQGTERYVVFETVADILEDESAPWPILLVVDDLQWADTPSLQLMEHVLRHERPGRLLMVGTVRSPGDLPNPALERMVAALERDGLATRLGLPALTEDEIDRLLAEGGWDADVQAREVLQATAGNPFFVTELAAHARLNRSALGTLLPDTVRDMLNVRFERLDDRANRVLAAAAVAGGSASLTVLAAAAQLDGDALLDAVDVTIASGLLVEEGASGRLTFPHALVRQAVLDRLTSVRRRALHARIAEVIRSGGRTEGSAAELAHHSLAAGALVDPADAARAALAAGNDDFVLLAYEQAGAWAERALAAAPAGDHRLRTDVHILRSRVGRALGDRTVARAAADQAAAEARAAGDGCLLADAALNAGLSASGTGYDIDGADVTLVALLEEALAALPPGEDGHRVRLLSVLSATLATEDRARAEAASAEAVEIAERVGDPGLLAAARLARRMGLWRRDMLEERTREAEQALELARRAQHTRLELNALLYLIGDYMEAGRVEESRRAFAEFRQIGDELHQAVYTVFADFVQGTFHLLAGEYDAAQRMGEGALAAGLASHGPNSRHAYGGQVFCLAWDRGELASTLPLVEAIATGEHVLPIWKVAYAGALYEADRIEESRAVYDEILADGRVNLPDDSLFFTGAGFLVEVARAHRDAEGAALLRATLEPYCGRIAITGLGGTGIGPVTRYVGVAAHLTGDLDAADRLLRRAHDEAVAIGSPPHRAKALRDLARVLVDRGEPGDVEEAVALVEQARELAASIGMVLRGLPDLSDATSGPTA